MKTFENFMEEVGKFLEQADAFLEEITKESGAEPKKKGVSWEELSNWIAESENVGEFEMGTDFGDPTYVKKDDDDYGSCDCEYCIDDDDFNYDEYDEYDDCNKQESETPPERLSLLDYREALFRHIEKKNPEHRAVERLELTEAFSSVIWEVLAGPNTATPEEISAAHMVFTKSRYLLASVTSRLNCRVSEIDLEGVETEIKKYLKEKN